MIPSDPTSSGPNPLLQNLTTLQNDFQKFDTAKQGAGADRDNIVSTDDFKAVVKDGGKSGRFSQADVEAAKFFLDHPEALAHMDTAAVSDNVPGIHEEPDNKIGQLDVQAALRDAGDFDGAATFFSQQPAVPADHRDTAQQDADMVLSLQDAGVDPNAQFTQMLQQHHGDAGYLSDLFGALGANGAGRALFDALSTGGQSRTEARSAIDTLKAAGLLTDHELAVAQFKTSAMSGGGFTLKTLLEADQVQREVEVRRATLKGTDSHPKDTAQNDAYDAYLTIKSPQNAAQIKAIAQRYGIDPALLGGTVASEMDFDNGLKDEFQDGLWRNTPAADVATLLSPLKLVGVPVDKFTAAGVTSVTTKALDWAIGELASQHDPSAAAAIKFRLDDIDRSHAGDFNNSVEAAAIVLAAETDLRKSHGASISTPTDMAVTWAAFRSGVKGVMPDAKSYTLDAFLNDRLDPSTAGNVVAQTGDPSTVMGGNAYQSLPYFEMLQSDG